MNRAHALTDTEHTQFPGPFESDQEIRRIGLGLLDHSLPQEEWNHAAHCAATIYFMLERPEIDLDRRMPLIIRSYNVATGVANTYDSGYHETITQLFLKVIRQFLCIVSSDTSLHEIVNFFMRSPFCKLEYLLLFYSRSRLFSIQARRQFVESDLRPFPAQTCRPPVNLVHAAPPDKKSAGKAPHKFEALRPTFMRPKRS